MRNLILTRLRKYIIVPITAIAIIVTAQPVSAAVIYEKKKQEIVTKGITYENSMKVTTNGLIDVHTIYIDITNPNVMVKPVQSAGTYGTKETASQMLSESGALAGVNADYFDMAFSPATSFGPVVVDGEIISLEEERQGYSTFFIDGDNNPFIEYVEPDIQFLNNGVNNIKVHAMNKFRSDFNAIYYDRNALINTEALDAKYPDLVKFVVTDGMITYISGGGETVEVPENGYIILCAATYAQYFYDSVKVGDTAEMKIVAAFDYDTIVTAIGGAGKMLENGNYSNYGYVVGAASRQPRTAIGISQDRTKLILTVVDGRSHSIGATHSEMADIMKDLGAWNAMQLDGGGSSTLVAKTIDDDSIVLQNTPSEGTQRRVVNSLGVFNTAELGEATSLYMSVSSDKVFAGTPITVHVTGLDDNYRKTALPEGGVTYYSNDVSGIWQGNVFYPSTAGKIELYASFNGFTEMRTVDNMVLAQIIPSKESLKMVQGESIALTFEGISSFGQSGEISKLNYDVVPAELGTVTPEGVFTAKGGTKGYIKCYLGDIAVYIDVSIGTKSEVASSFNDMSAEIEFIASLNTVTGSAVYSDVVNTAGNYALALTYSFGVSESTQAAYIKLINPITFKQGLGGIQLSVYGQSQGGWVRAKLIDAAGDEYLADITKDINFTGWNRFTIQVPADAVQPVKLERLYIAALQNTDTSTKSVFFDDLAGLYAVDYGEVSKPESSAYTNPYRASIAGVPEAGVTDLTFVGRTMLVEDAEKPDNYLAIQTKAMAKFTENGAKATFIGTTDIEGVTASQWSAGYNFTLNGNYALIKMSAAKGGLSATSPYNWSFANEALNSTAKHIIIMMDEQPSELSSKKEYELFRGAIDEIIATGKTVTIISASSGDTDATVMDGANYINLGGLFNEDGSVKDGFKVLRLRINGDSIKFDLQNI